MNSTNEFSITLNYCVNFSDCKSDEIDCTYKPHDELTKLGPPAYCGDILDNPEMLWSEDVWDDQRESCVKEQLKHQGIAISMYWRLKYETKADTFWHKFYKRNQANFYKDRHYLDVEFPELSESKRQIELLEVGCGVGNAILPLLQDNPNLFVHAFDFAESAVNILRDEAVRCNLSHRISVSVCCVAKDKLPVEDESVDFVLCMFVLSAIAPQHHHLVITKLARTLRKGGKLLIRDYGRYDEAQLRFKRGSKLDDNFYVRQDGTCAYYFDLDELVDLCESVSNNRMSDGSEGFKLSNRLLKKEDAHYIRRQMANRLQQTARRRIWVQCKFVKL